MMNYDTWKTTTPQDFEKVACHCEHCEEEIMVGQEATKSDDGTFCDLECFLEYMIEGTSARQITVEGDH